MLIDLLILAITLSMDSFGIGITYGIRNIKMEKKSILVLFFICLALSFFSFCVGHAAISLFPDFIPKILGCILLICMGGWIIMQSFSSKTKISNILKDPALVDFDGSQSINGKEIIALSLAISVDSLVCGFGFSIITGFSYVFPILVAFFHVFLLILGMFCGKKITSVSSFPQVIWSRISGILLILFGITKIVQ